MVMFGLGTQNEKRLNVYGKMFPTGTGCFMVPISDELLLQKQQLF